MFNPDFFFHDFGSIVLDLRKKYDISQEYCAELACIHRNSLNAIERGCSDLSCITMTNLCLALGIEELRMDFNEKSLRLVRAGERLVPFPESMIYESLGGFIDSLRAERRISRESLSDRIGIHRNTIARMESGRTESRTSALLRLYGFFGIWRVSRAPAGSCTVYGVTAHCIDSGRDYSIYLK